MKTTGAANGCTGDLARHFRFRGASDEPGSGGERKPDQRTALMVVSHRDGDAPPTEPHEGVDECQPRIAPNTDSTTSHHGATVVTIAATSGMNRRSQYRLMSHPLQRRRGDLRVVSDDQERPDRAQPVNPGARRLSATSGWRSRGPARRPRVRLKARHASAPPASARRFERQ